MPRFAPPVTQLEAAVRTLVGRGGARVANWQRTAVHTSLQNHEKLGRVTSAAAEQPYTAARRYRAATPSRHHVP